MAAISGVTYHKKGGLWVAVGRPNLGEIDRSALIYDGIDGAPAYEPDETTAGVPEGTALTTVNPTASLPTSTGMVAPSSPGFWEIKTSGTVVSEVDLHGCLKISATSCRVERSRLRGRLKTSNPAKGYYQPIADMASSLTSSGWARWVDCTISCDDPGPEQYGFKGRYFIAERCIVEYVVDGAQQYNGGAQYLGTIFRHLTWFSNDPNQGPEGSHTDATQLQGGSTATLVAKTCVYDSGISPAGSSNLGVLINAKLDNNTVGDYTLAYCFFKTKDSGGARVAIPLNIATSMSYKGVYGCRIQLGRDDYHIIAPSTVRTKIQAEPIPNRDYDTGGTITIAQGAG